MPSERAAKRSQSPAVSLREIILETARRQITPQKRRGRLSSIAARLWLRQLPSTGKTSTDYKSRPWRSRAPKTCSYQLQEKKVYWVACRSKNDASESWRWMIRCDGQRQFHIQFRHRAL